MKITMKRVTKKLPDRCKVESLYNSSFPDDERAPFRVLLSRAEKGKADFRAVYANDVFIGFAYTVTEGDLSYLFYLAVEKELRGKGNGSLILRAVKEKYKGNRIFLALEQLDETAENYPERVSRRYFYEKNGLRPMSLSIIEGKVVYDVMGIGGDVKPEEYGRMMKNYMGFFMSLLLSGHIVMQAKEQ